MVLAAGTGWSTSARAEAATPTVAVIEVSGRIDPIVADFIRDSLRTAERGGSEALVI
ncbi:MAG: hypothetical protein JOZ68_03025, partial [Acidimicrobiia bacterium]|nr:hypothetical protein [Acidimicrobiia bacterium]